MVLAVLDTRCGLALGGNDVYLNVAGGLRITEPAADLAVAASLLSSFFDQPVAADWVIWGEIGLSGEIRAVGQAEARLKEAAKLGFAEALVPAVHRPGSGAKAAPDGPIATRRLGHVQDLTSLFHQDKSLTAGQKR
jgi:DNA repair protein RadA/Sms